MSLRLLHLALSLLLSCNALAAGAATADSTPCLGTGGGRRWRGFLPLVRDGQSQLEGILVVRKDSPVRRIADLSGATVAFPASNAFAASLLPRALLSRAGLHDRPG
jgi:ABC-type nitrate/sulfonate/bicarbonate transport system substrate-binding protein